MADMKVLLVYLCIYVLEATSDDTQNFSLQLVENVFESKCINNAHNDNAFLEFKEALINFKACGATAFPEEPPDPVEDHEMFCTTLRNSRFYICVEDLIKGVAACLDDTEKYLPHLILHAVNETYDELCGVDGLSNSKLIFEMRQRAGICGSPDVFRSEFECLNNLTVFENLNNNMINFNKPDVCTDLEALQKCFIGIIRRYCKNENDYSPVLDLVFRPLMDECNIALD